MKNQTKFLLMLTVLLIIFIFSACQNSNEPTTKNSSNKENRFELKLIEDELYLLNFNKTIKKYEINPNVLPSEDILVLIEGIKVKDEEEADLMAENFDG